MNLCHCLGWHIHTTQHLHAQRSTAIISRQWLPNFSVRIFSIFHILHFFKSNKMLWFYKKWFARYCINIRSETWTTFVWCIQFFECLTVITMAKDMLSSSAFAIRYGYTNGRCAMHDIPANMLSRNEAMNLLI